MAAFVAIELKRERDPMLDVRLFRGAGLRRCADCGVLDLGLDFRGVPLSDALSPERPRLLASRRPDSVPAIVAGRVRRGRGLRQPHVSRFGALADGRRSRDHRRVAPPDGAHRARTRLDAVAAWIRPRWHRHRADEPGARLHCRQRRPARAVRHGVRRRTARSGRSESPPVSPVWERCSRVRSPRS